MRARESVRGAWDNAIVIGLAVFILSLGVHAQQVGSVRWAVRLSPQDTGSIEVYVDATGLRTNVVVDKVMFRVAFYDAQHRLLKQQGFDFLDQTLRALGPTKYRKVFKHSVPGATSAEAVDLSGYGGAGGAHVDTGPVVSATPSEWPADGLENIGTTASVAPGLQLLVHLADIGDVIVRGNEFGGTRGESRQLEGFQLRFTPPIAGLSLRYRAHLQDVGDVPFVNEGEYVGTRGQSRRLEGFAIELTGPSASKYDVLYMAHIQDIGDTAFFRNGEYCGTRGQSKRIEGMMVRVLPKR